MNWVSKALLLVLVDIVGLKMGLERLVVESIEGIGSQRRGGDVVISWKGCNTRTLQRKRSIQNESF